MRVIDVKVAYAQRSEKFINLITFEDPQQNPYVAEEPATIRESKFKIGKIQSFRISFPANQPGKKDWIEYIGEGAFAIPETKMRLAIAAFTHVSKYEIGLSDQEMVWRTVEVGNLIQQAAQLL